MAIKLVDKDVIKKYESDGSSVSYKEALPRDIERIYQKHQVLKKKNFNIDFDAAKSEILVKYVVGWEGVTDANGAAVPYQPEYLDAMPSEDRNNLFTLITNGKLPEDKEDGEDEGNF